MTIAYTYRLLQGVQRRELRWGHDTWTCVLMRFLFDLTHPAVVHIYLPVIQELRQRHHEIAVVSRDKDLTTSLLEEAGLQHTILSRSSFGKLPMMLELAQREVGLLQEALKFKPNVIAGTSANAARVAKLIGARSLINNEDDAAMVPLFRWIAYPLASTIVTPWVLGFENYGPKHLIYPAFEKMFYLHPARFSVDKGVGMELSRNSKDGAYILFRFSALRAHHDVGAKGVPKEVIDRLLAHFSPLTNIWLSSENPLPPEWQKYAFPLAKSSMHHALAQASMLVCDSQSMSVEAAVLGVKSFRLNSFVGKLSVLNELDRRELSEGFLPGQDGLFESRVLEYYKELSAGKAAQMQRLEKLLRETMDPVPWFVELLELLASGRALSDIYEMDKRFTLPQAQVA